MKTNGIPENSSDQGKETATLTGNQENDSKLFEREISENPPQPEGKRTEFQRDRDRIIHSKAFRRLMHKTQVFINPDSEHFRTRMTHTLEVAQIARSIARYIGANEDLTEAIALGHDLGHTPFGHKGEEVLDSILKEYGLWFNHATQSFRTVSYLEEYPRFPFGNGLNLTSATRAGILRHSSKYFKTNKEAIQSIPIINLEGEIRCFSCPETLEEKIVRIADDIAWVNHDWDDGVRAGILSYSLLGREIINNLGAFQGERINKLINDLEKNFDVSRELKFSPEIRELFESLKEKLKSFLQKSIIIRRTDLEVERQIKTLFTLFMENPNLLPQKTRETRKLYIGPDLCFFQKRHNALIIADYISGMTDDWFARIYNDLVYFNRMRLRPAESSEWIWIERVDESKGNGKFLVTLKTPEYFDLGVFTKRFYFEVVSLVEAEHRKKRVEGKKGRAEVINEKKARVFLENGSEIDLQRDVLILGEI